MTNATLSPLSPGAGALAALAVRGGLGLASWGLRLASRRNDRERQLDRLEARTAARRALAERDALTGRATTRLL
ncbi:hypothetical protein PX701_14880 [Agromyces sp. H3Y2-19a]|uniref:hypothetical protein n=1 Tax=Agromyces TaxID=33877 RepID=UPI001E2B6767|nr:MULTISPECIES: hypothetical protein [Agromyces]MCD5347514.1 hypothetical protein [Agromyces sp. S2-1-8]MDF0514915.1 hypothetical protein [Agromyces chromiiresistens]